jgi:hypothetical protein
VKPEPHEAEIGNLWREIRATGRRLRERLDALGPAPRAELVHVLMPPDFKRAGRISEFWGDPQDPHLRRVVDRWRGGPDTQGGARWNAPGGRPRLVSVAGRSRSSTCADAGYAERLEVARGISFGGQSQVEWTGGGMKEDVLE